MGQHTDISWADTTVNPVTGCDGCELWPGECYAGTLHETRLAKSLPMLYAADFTEVRLAPGRMAKAAAMSDLTGKPRPDKPWLDGRPRVIFVGDMGDVMSKAVTFDYFADEVVGNVVSPKGRRHVWMVLTKRPSRLAEFGHWLSDERGMEWPANLWAGASVTSAKSEGRARLLAYVPAPVKFLSVEPLNGPVDFPVNLLRNFQLVIVGGGSGPKARPCDLAWIRAVVKATKDAGSNAFVKQLGAKPFGMWDLSDDPGDIESQGRRVLSDPKGGDLREFPPDLCLREFPAVTQGV